eukprot:scaffold189236_cov28-Tisochrysis_lutea.AAC.1
MPQNQANEGSMSSLDFTAVWTVQLHGMLAGRSSFQLSKHAEGIMYGDCNTVQLCQVLLKLYTQKQPTKLHPVRTLYLETAMNRRAEVYTSEGTKDREGKERVTLLHLPTRAAGLKQKGIRMREKQQSRQASTEGGHALYAVARLTCMCAHYLRLLNRCLHSNTPMP